MEYTPSKSPNEKLHDPRLLFNERDHIYSLEDAPEIELVSATTFIHKFFNPFDREKIASKLLQNVPKYQDYTKEELFEEWKQSGVSGTNVHAALEDFILTFNTEGGSNYSKSLDKFCVTGEEINKARIGMDWLGDHLFTKENLILYPEVKVVSRDWKIAGMMDLLVHDQITDKYTILDWKTNRRISKTSYGGAKGNRECTADLDDCNFNHYTLQLSLYKYILEREYGLNVEKQALVHVSEKKATVMETEHVLPTLTNMFAEAVKRGEIKWT